MSERVVRILDGSTFIVSDERGDIDGPIGVTPTGLFVGDTRFLSRWVLTLDGSRLTVLTVDDLQYFEVRFFLVSGGATQYVDADLSVFRDRWLGDSFHETVRISNHRNRAIDLIVRLDAEADFADLFEVKGGMAKKGRTYARAEPQRLTLGYRRESFHRETIITANVDGAVDDKGLTVAVRIVPLGQWSMELSVETSILDSDGHQLRTGPMRRGKQHMRNDLELWKAQMPRVECDWEPLTKAYDRSIVDLAALRFSLFDTDREAVPAAGLPWFMTLFGRDSILTSLQALPFAPKLAAQTLLLLGELQGTDTDDFREEEPGKILHELRFGETVAFHEQPHTPYYGSADSTPLWVVLLDEYERWTGDAQLVRQLEPEARAALNWIAEYSDVAGNGFVSYRRRNEATGLENQCWKDSWDSIVYHDGRFPSFPRATCELQGYAYDAKIRGARLARHFWNDPAYALQLEREAADLKRRFNADFWIDEGQYYALALDGEGRKADALSSNIGHLLWSGIVDDARASAVAQHLVGPRLYSGWGVRTLAEGENSFNPVGYHVGTVWPFDNSFIAWGLRRYGFKEEAARVAKGILEAASYFAGRLPEAFAGYGRRQTRYPVEYPTACSPQAWSTGTPLLLLRTMLGLQPIDEFLIVDPRLPVGIDRLALLDLTGKWGHQDAFGRRVSPRSWRPRL